MNWVSLITDFGHSDPYLAQLKASVWSTQPEVRFIDISHDIKPHDIVSAGWILKNTFKDCPVGTIHFISVLNNYNNNASHILFQYEGHYFIGPNNGVFSLAFEKLPQDIFEIKSEPFDAHSLKAILVKTIDHISNLRPIEDLGHPVKNLIMRIQLQPVINKYMIRGSVIYIDHFENVILNISKEQFEKARAGRRFSIFIKRNDPITEISSTYQEVGVGETLCLFNSFDHLEIAIHGGHAASMLGLAIDEMIQIDFD